MYQVVNNIESSRVGCVVSFFVRQQHPPLVQSLSNTNKNILNNHGPF
jgi:hypothetical protein